jgi:hypothetical protein
LAIEDFDSEATIYTADPVWDPCAVVAIEVEDAGGRPLPANERFPNSSICLGHGFGPRPFPKGKVIPLERTLRTEGWLPNRPGIYRIVITWAPCVGQRTTDFPDGHYSADLKPYAVVHALANIRVINNDASQSK